MPNSSLLSLPCPSSLTHPPRFGFGADAEPGAGGPGGNGWARAGPRSAARVRGSRSRFCVECWATPRSPPPPQPPTQPAVRISGARLGDRWRVAVVSWGKRLEGGRPSPRAPPLQPNPPSSRARGGGAVWRRRDPSSSLRLGCCQLPVVLVRRSRGICDAGGRQLGEWGQGVEGVEPPSPPSPSPSPPSSRGGGSVRGARVPAQPAGYPTLRPGQDPDLIPGPWASVRGSAIEIFAVLFVSQK